MTVDFIFIISFLNFNLSFKINKYKTYNYTVIGMDSKHLNLLLPSFVLAIGYLQVCQGTLYEYFDFNYIIYININLNGLFLIVYAIRHYITTFK